MISRMPCTVGRRYTPDVVQILFAVNPAFLHTKDEAYVKAIFTPTTR